MKKLFFTVAMLATLTGAMAQNVNKMIDQKDVERIIGILAADDMQGRAIYTPGIEKAAKFIEGEFAAAGIAPLPGNTGFRQNLPADKKITPGKTTVNINMSSVSSTSTYCSATASFEWSDDADVQVVIEGPGKNYQQDMRALATSGKKTLVIVDSSYKADFKAAKDRAATGGGGRSAGGGGGRGGAAAAPTAPIVYVLGNWDRIRSFEANCKVTVEDSPLRLFNVAGMIPGKSKPDEFVVFSGHYDHLGIGKGMKPDSIYNGADDDASGITAVIELAKYYKQLNNNERTLIFVAFTNEEHGESGSRYFTTTVNPDKVVAGFNIEMIGKPSKWGQNSAFITGFERSDFGTILQKNLKGTSFTFYPDPYPGERLFYRSDNATLAQAGVPAHTISTDQIADPPDPDYHKVTDEIKTLDMANITPAIRAIALSSKTIVSGKDTPTRIPKQ